MALRTFTAVPSNDSNVNFYLWTHALSDAIQNVGIVKTADTGQIDWPANVNATPTATDQTIGYEIFRFNDALQSTAPMYLKLEYGSAGANARPSLWWTLGTNTHGNGTLSGFTSSRFQISLSASSNATPLACYVSGANNRLSFALFQNFNTGLPNMMVFNLERTHENSGDDNDEGLIALSTASTASAWRQLYFSMASGAGATEGSLGSLTPTGNSASSGTQIAVFPIFCHRGGFLNPFMNALVYANTNITTGVPISFTMYGGLKEYMPLGAAGASGTSPRAATAAAYSMLLRHE